MLTVALCCAGALALWPDPDARLRLRVTRLVGRRSGTARPGVVRVVRLPPAAAAAVALGGALLSTPLVALLASGATFLGARAWLSARALRESDGRLQALADGLGALAADLRGGRSLEMAARAAAAACADDACGRALTTAIRDPTAQHSGRGDPVLADALTRIAAAVRLSGRTGCSLAAVAGAVEDDLRARHRLRLELRAATAAPRASAALLAGLPVLGLAMGHGVGADPWGVLTRTGTGQILLVAGVALETTGVAWARRLVPRAVRS